jgi:DNA helicase HerA-like ATPase
MTPEHEIGRVVAVDTAQVTVEMNRDLKALTRSTYEGTVEVGRINSYIIIPVGARRIVAMVTRVVMTEDSELKADRTMVSLPSTKRLMKATMIGSIDGKKFRQGINVFPVLDSKVFLTTKHDLDSIFGQADRSNSIDPEKPGFCIPVGRSAVFPDYDVRIDPDAFFGKHAAVIGSTGSGKSCTIATILQSVVSTEGVENTHIIILDTNGEYRSAFQKEDSTKPGTWHDAHADKHVLYIPTDSAEPERLVIPYWMMNADDMVRLFRAAPGVQRPVLLHALTDSRQEGSGPGWVSLRALLLQQLHQMRGHVAKGDGIARQNANGICDGLLAAIRNPKNLPSFQELADQYPYFKDHKLSETVSKAKGIVAYDPDDKSRYDVLGLDKQMQLDSMLGDTVGALSATPAQGVTVSLVTADQPAYFSKHGFQHEHLENAMARDSINNARTRDNCATMLTRIERLLEDTRFEFLFGPVREEMPNPKAALATFLRDLLGLSSAEQELSPEEQVPRGTLPFYDRQRIKANAANVVILDLSLLASEVLENVTALLGRLIHEFLQRLSDPSSGIKRGEFPVVLVLEEAQNYIREGRGFEDESISKQVFERIAREGRKFGLGLVIASQRPSELSKTVLSQCNSFVVHRLQNPEDLRYFKEIVPGIYGQLLDQLPALAPQSALVLGECVQAPVLVQMRTAVPRPESKNPQFFKSWTKDGKVPNVEAVCAKWEGVQPNVSAAIAQANGDDGE